MALFRDYRRSQGGVLRAHHIEPGGRLMVFGRTTLLWDNPPSPEEYFRDLYGVDSVDTLDVSDYEGASVIHNLNDPELPENLKGRYRAVSMGGTLQLVFHVGIVLRKSAELLEVGGAVFCDAPSNNRQENAYYQICPTLKFDFYQANGFELGASVATLFSPDRKGLVRRVPVYPGEAHTLNYIPARVSHLLVAKKLSTSTCDKVPVNSTYLFKQTGQPILWRFRATPPRDSEDGKQLPTPVRRFSIDAKRLSRADECWAYPFRERGLPASSPARPFRSRALVYEDGKLLSWIVSDKDMVRERPGTFNHSGQFVYFTSSDGSDPTKNDRLYEIVFPQPFDGLKPYAPDPNYRHEEL